VYADMDGGETMKLKGKKAKGKGETLKLKTKTRDILHSNIH